MRIFLKEKQVDVLASFLIDISKGVLLAVLGVYATGGSIGVSVIVTLSVFAMISLVEGLYLFGKI